MRKTTPADAEDFVGFLVKKGLARNSTVPKHTQIASQFWNRAIKEKLIEDNPFDGFKKTVKKNPNRFYQVKIASIRRIPSACPDHGWGLSSGLLA